MQNSFNRKVQCCVCVCVGVCNNKHSSFEFDMNLFDFRMVKLIFATALCVNSNECLKR